ncbi:MAG: SulP family inorganic anion transporter [Bdellovibrionia bacterium]
MWNRLKSYMKIFDHRYEDLNKYTWKLTVYRDFSAGLITALTAIPMAMGFAMASGLRPEQGIIAGALACVVGRTFGGSKYQVYGPTAAFIPIIYAITHQYNHAFLVFVSLIAGVILIFFGLLGFGKYVKLMPHSIVVGFTIGIAIAIATSNMGDVLGLHEKLGGGLFGKLHIIFAHLSEVNYFAVFLALFTFGLTKYLMKISIYIPAPLIAIVVSTLLASTLFSGHDIILVKDKYGQIPNDFFVLTLFQIPPLTFQVLLDVAYFVVAIVFVSGVESLLCSSMADRLANNKKTPFDPDRELFGQGLVQIFVPLLNGFPCTGALARTATSIKAGAVTPLAGYFKAILKLGIAYFAAAYLEHVPMACIGGILVWVASNMIKVSEIKEVFAVNRIQSAVLVYTAIMVPVTDFLTGVLSALFLYLVLSKSFRPQPKSSIPAEAGVGIMIK